MRAAWGRAWRILGVVAALLELAALLRPGSGDTLTEHLRPWIRAHWSRILAAIAGLVWLAYHFLIEGP